MSSYHRRVVLVVLASAVMRCASTRAAHAANLAVTSTNPPLNGMGPPTTTIAVTFDRAVSLWRTAVQKRTSDIENDVNALS